MKIRVILFSLLTLMACSTETEESGDSSTTLKNSVTADTTEKPIRPAEVSTASEPLLGERIDGPANIRDTINGKVLFTLNDDALVTNTPLQNDWYLIGLIMEIDIGEAESVTLKEGQQIIVDGKAVGTIKSDMTLFRGTNFEKSWVELIGYTHKDNIKPASVIETALADYLQSIGNERSEAKFQSFIQQFDLEKGEQIEGYTIYSNYENWLEDPSPMWRIGLVFQNDQLVSILHSRPLKVAGTTDHKLSRGFDCLVYDDLNNSRQLVKMFNDFVSSVD